MTMLVLADAPQLLVALEQSALGAAIRESVWAYPVANVGHILALMLLAGAVAIMDLRLLGAFPATPAAPVVRRARSVAALGLLLMAVTGLVLFTAEASHVAKRSDFWYPAGAIFTRPKFLGVFVVDDFSRDRIELNSASAAISDVAEMTKQRAGLADGDFGIQLRIATNRL